MLVCAATNDTVNNEDFRLHVSVLFALMMRCTMYCTHAYYIHNIMDASRTDYTKISA